MACTEAMARATSTEAFNAVLATIMRADELVKAGDELRVAVADQERDALERPGAAEVPGLLRDHRSSGLVVVPARGTRRV